MPDQSVHCTVQALDDAQLAAIVETARRLLRLNVSEGLAAMTTYTGFRRTTRRDDPQERLWVYGRARLPCRRCGTPISLGKQGTDARLTYWCARARGSGHEHDGGSVRPCS